MEVLQYKQEIKRCFESAHFVCTTAILRSLSCPILLLLYKEPDNDDGVIVHLNFLAVPPTCQSVLHRR